MSARTRHIYEFGPFRLDATERVLLRDEVLMPLTLKAFDTLLMLLENSGHIVERDELINRVWRDTVVEENNLTKNISALRKILGEDSTEQPYIETVPRRGYRFVASVREVWEEQADVILHERTRVRVVMEEEGEEVIASKKAWSESASELFDEPLPKPRRSGLSVPPAKPEPLGGGVPLDSEFYILRPTDDEFQAAMARRDSIVLVKGARQVGKTSLLARGLHRARQAGARIVVSDFQDLSATDLASAESLFLTFEKAISEQLDLDVSPRVIWDADDSANTNFGRFMRREVLQKVGAPIVWGLDEVDRLFTCPFGSEVFGLFRSWHNKRALDPAGPWHWLTLAIAYATEAHLFITDMNQSPFNVGTRLTLDDFTVEQVTELNRRYRSPLRDEVEVARFYTLLNGQPYLTQRGLCELARGMELTEFETHADRDDGPLGDHLRRLLVMLSRDQALCDVVRAVLDDQPCPTLESFYRLRSAGVIIGDTARQAKPRCQLYATFLKRHLL
jgi:DNA-binding winged helix-turn-helix (wHTH) protein